MRYEIYQILKPLAEKIDNLSNPVKNKSHKDYVDRINITGKIIRILAEE